MDKKFIYIAGGGLLVVIILILVLVLGKDRTQTTTVPKDTVMTIWDYNNEKTAYDSVMSNYQTLKDIKVTYVTKNLNTYFQDAIAAMVEGKGPDVWIIPANMVAKYKNILEPMPDYGYADNANKLDDIEVFSSLYPSVVVQNNVLNNKIYGVPLAGDKLKLFVNSAVINEGISEYYKENPEKERGEISATANNPRTWDDIVEAVKIITKKSSNKITRSTIALGTSNNIATSNDILTLLMMQNGAKMNSDDLSTAQFHTAQNLFGNIQYPGTKALEFYASFANPKSENYTWNSTMPNAVRAFAEGQTAMLIDYASAETEIKNISPNLNFQTLSLPQIKESAYPANLIKYDTLVVPKSSKLQALAWRFVLTATNNTFASSYANSSGKTTLLGSNDNDIIYTQTWYNPDPDKTKTIFNNTINQVNNGANAQTALDGAASQITALLNKLKNQ